MLHRKWSSPVPSVKSPLPKFAKPPVVEVALSVQFDRLSVPTTQLALVWSKYRERFPVLEEKPELEPAIERFGASKIVGSAVRFEVGAIPATRLWFVSSNGCDLIQVQRDRFVRNWRKTENEPKYPSYESLKECFALEWKLFADFVQNDLGLELAPNQCEVTYINILEGVNPGEINSAVAWASGKYSDDYLSSPEIAEITLRYIINDVSDKPWGRLHVVASPAIQSVDGKLVTRLAMTARGAPISHDFDGALTALNSCHDAVVRGFASITTTDMHAKWERTI